MPLVILKSSYIKSLTHFVNLITYCDSKVEAQMAVGADGELRTMTTEEILKLAPDKELKLQLENGKTVTTTVEKYSKKYTEKIACEHYQTEIYTDDNIEREFQTDKWLKYIANRPSSKGLFNQFGAIDEIEAVQCAEENFNSIKWSHIVSLERADAERLGYDNPQAWQTLIAAKLPDIARLHNISLENIVVNASYHDKDHHPHIHLFVYSQDSREGHFKGTGALINRTERIKSLFTNEIFRGDLEHIKVQKNEIQTQLQQALRQKCIAIAQKTHIPSSELLERFSEISNIMLDTQGRRYYEYQSAGVKTKINELLKCAVKSDKYINQIYLQLKANQEEFVRAYNDDDEKVKERMNEWEKRFFEPNKHDDKRLHNIVIEYASKVASTNVDCANYVLSQSLWDIIPGICAYAENQLDLDEISYNECALIKDNVQDIAKSLTAKLSYLENTEQIEKEFDRQYLKLTSKLLNERLMSSDMTLSLYTPNEFADFDNINATHYTHRLDMTAKKQSNLYITAQSAAKTFYDTLGEKAVGSIILLHNARNSARTFQIIENGKVKQIYSTQFCAKAAIEGILPKRYELFDEETSANINADNAGTKEKINYKLIHTQTLYTNQELAELKTALRNALTTQYKDCIKSISKGRPFQLLDSEEKATLNTILQNVVIHNQDTAKAFEKVIAEQHRLYCKRFDERTAQKLTEYTRKALFEPKEYEASPIQNTAVFCSTNKMQPQCDYTARLLLFRLAAMMAGNASMNRGNNQNNIAKHSKKPKTAIEKSLNKDISAENEEQYSGFEY